MRSRSLWQWLPSREFATKFLEWKDKERVRRQKFVDQRALAASGLKRLLIVRKAFGKGTASAVPRESCGLGLQPLRVAFPKSQKIFEQL